MKSRLLSVVSLIGFRWRYATLGQRCWNVLCLLMFAYSCVELCRKLLINDIKLWLDLPYAGLGIVFSIVAISKSLFGVLFYAFSERRLVPFKERNDSGKIRLQKGWNRIGLSANDVNAGFEVVRMNGPVDFIASSPRLNKALVEGGDILYKEINARRIPLWRRINRQLSSATELLYLKQRVSPCNSFFNESKVAVVGADYVNDTSVALRLEIAKSCYYASYLSNEVYRDAVYDVIAENVIDNGVVDIWQPFDRENGNVVLREFDGYNSMHIGVNTIGLTSDGYFCIWKQVQGEHSREMSAPTGSGSMDWADMCISRDNGRSGEYRSIKDAIIYGVERELTEESFDGETKKKLRSSGKTLETRIIGFYRWGSRGGLPGFICATKIPLGYSDIAPRGKGEVNKQKSLKDLRFVGGMTKIEKLTEISKFENRCGKDTVPSVPLQVCLRFLRAALEDIDFDRFFSVDVRVVRS